MVLCIPLNVLAQSDNDESANKDFGQMLNKVFNTKVYMDIDTLVFDTRQNNLYFSEEGKAMIMTMVAPQSFAKAEEHFNKESKKEGYTLHEKKKLTHNGKNILNQKGLVEGEAGKGLSYIYVIEATPESTIFITAMHMEGDEAKYFPVIERAALLQELWNNRRSCAPFWRLSDSSSLNFCGVWAKLQH